MSGLFWVQTVCKSYQQTTKLAACGERVNMPITMVSNDTFSTPISIIITQQSIYGVIVYFLLCHESLNY